MAITCAWLGKPALHGHGILVQLTSVNPEGIRRGIYATPHLTGECKFQRPLCSYAALAEKKLQCRRWKRRAVALAVSAEKASLTLSEEEGKKSGTLVKVCGVTTPDDALVAIRAGADFIGMILWPKAKRSISFNVAAEVVKAARAHNAEPVGVFVDEDAATIASVCEEVGISVAQLHGDKARAALPDLPKALKVIYVLQADESGKIRTPLPPKSDEREMVDWILIDGMVGGSGTKLDWVNLEVPRGVSRNGWLLAGGLNPDNVAAAIQILQPPVVDVSSGVTMANGIAKDPARVAAFIMEAKK